MSALHRVTVGTIKPSRSTTGSYTGSVSSMLRIRSIPSKVCCFYPSAAIRQPSRACVDPALYRVTYTARIGQFGGSRPESPRPHSGLPMAIGDIGLDLLVIEVVMPDIN